MTKKRMVSVRLNVGEIRKNWLSILTSDSIKDSQYFIIDGAEQIKKQKP